MPDFVSRFGELGADQQYFLSPARQSEITSLLSAGESLTSRQVSRATTKKSLIDDENKGTFFGALAQAFIADRESRLTRLYSRLTCVDVGIGRKYSVFFWSCVFTVGSVIQVSRFHPPSPMSLSIDGNSNRPPPIALSFN